jgi:LysR family transcriptional regulator for bpeEF and oprC
MDQLFCMRVFVRIVEQGACSRAADDLGVSRATVTTALSQLEKRLGVRLLQRTTRRLSLTDEGRAYYADCVRILGDVDEAEDALTHARLSPRGRLRVSIAQSFEPLGFFPLLARFMHEYPDLSVEVIVTDRAVNMVEEGIDCAVRAVEASRDALLVARTLFIARWLTCASPGYFAQHGVPGHPSEIAAHNCIRFVSPSTGRARDWLFDEGGVQTKRTPRGSLSLTSLDAAVAAARAGTGLAQVPDLLACDAVLAGELEPVLTEHIVQAPAVVLAYPGNRYLPAKVRAFAAFLQKAYPRQGWWPKIAAHLQRRPAA